ncbi:MAG: hypothetical protein KDA99_06395, partial [Planctomycetales bacterium]|nr:hypothetical protein [Planctomycetales bacterium]
MRSVLIMGDRRMHWVTGHPPLATSPIIYGGVDLMRNAIEKMLETVRSVSSPTLWSSRLESEDKYCWNEPLGNSHQGVLRWEIKKTPVDGMNKVRYCLKNRRAIGRIVLPRMEDQLVARLLLGGFQSCQDRWRSDSRFNGDFFNKLMYEYHRKIFFKTPSTGVLSETHWDNSKAGLWTTDEFQQIIAKRNEVDAGDGDEIRYCKTSLRQVFALITQAFEPLLPNRDGCLRLSHAVPDVVVFDDLGLQVGKLKFSLPKKESCPVSSPIAFFNTDGMKYFEHVLCEYLAHLRFDEVGRYEDFLALYKSRACLTEHALQFVVARLYALANSVAERGDQCPAEPA